MTRKKSLLKRSYLEKKSRWLLHNDVFVSLDSSVFFLSQESAWLRFHQSALLPITLQFLTQRKHNDFAFFSRHARARTESPGLLHYGMSPGVFPSMWLPSPCYPFLFPFLIPPLSWRPIYRLTLSFLDTLLNMSIVRSSYSSQSHFL